MDVLLRSTKRVRNRQTTWAFHSLHAASLSGPDGPTAHGFAGTELRFRPGVVVGGSDLAHDCGKERSIGYFLEPLCTLCLFSKQVRCHTRLGRLH